MCSINPLYFPTKKSDSIGGPTTFMWNLKEYLDQNNFTYLSSPEKAKLLFFPIVYSRKSIKEIKAKGGKVIQRLDGIYYPTQHGEEYTSLNSSIKDIYLNYADFVVFQSNYSRLQCFAMLGPKNKNQYKIIINGVDKRLFYPARKSFQPNLKTTISFVVCGVFRKHIMLDPIVHALDRVREKRNIELRVVGPIEDNTLKRLMHRDYIVYHGRKTQEEIAEVLRNSHIYISSQINDNCPNSVIEAISCGLPVVGLSSGAMPELLYFSKDLLAKISGDIFQRSEDIDIEQLIEKIDRSIEGFPEFRNRALDHSHLYSLEDCGEAYIQLFNQFLETNRYRGQITSNSKLKKHGKILRSKIVNTPQIISQLKKTLINYETDELHSFLFSIIREKCNYLSPFESLKFLFELENKVYQLAGKESVRFGNGIHSKHRHIGYHRFFTNNLDVGSNVLDVGCSTGELSNDIAGKVYPGKVFGVEIEKEKVVKAREEYNKDNLTFIHGNIFNTMPPVKIDVITLSNVLEHIENRVELLASFLHKYEPKKILIRVPAFDRDWRVPMKKELGIDYRLDTTHCIEYRPNEFDTEMTESGLTIVEKKVNWGEIWAVLVPSSNTINFVK